MILANPEKYWNRWKKLSEFERVNFFKAAVTLLVVKLGLTLLPFSRFRKVFHWFSSTNRQKEISQKQIEQTAWAVRAAADHLPFELLCLPRALATKFLLRNVSSLTLEIGVEINSLKIFEAHAWVERNGSVIIGDWPGTVSYKRLWVWE